MTDKKPLRNPNDYINVSVLRSNHQVIKEYLDKDGDGKDIGKFYDKAAIEKMEREKQKQKK